MTAANTMAARGRERLGAGVKLCKAIPGRWKVKGLLSALQGAGTGASLGNSERFYARGNRGTGKIQGGFR